MTIERWAGLVRQVQEERELIVLMREYCMTLSPADLEDLPAECRGSVRDAEHLAEMAVVTARCEVLATGAEPYTEAVQEMAQVFAMGLRRLREIRGRGTLR